MKVRKSVIIKRLSAPLKSDSGCFHGKTQTLLQMKERWSTCSDNCRNRCVLSPVKMSFNLLTVCASGANLSKNI